MRTLLILLAFSVGLTPLFAQQIDLSGQISIHNSRYRTGEIEYVANASVQAPFAGETSSDSEGLFGLTFQGIENGTIIKLSVEKAGLEVVNTYDLERVVLGQKPRLPIYLAPKGRLAQAQTELYQISKEALFARRDALIARLQGEKAESEAVLAELEQDWGIEINSIGEAMQLLDSKIEELQKRLPEFAQELAAKNLDFASDLYIQAYELYQAGDIEGAIAVLDNAVLKESLKDAMNTISQSISLRNTGLLHLEKVLDDFDLLAEIYLQSFQYHRAVQTYLEVISLVESDPTVDIYKLRLSTIYSDLAFVYRELSDFDNALLYQKKSTAVREIIWNGSGLEMALTYRDLGSLYGDISDFESSEKYILRSINLAEKQGVDSTILGGLYLDAAGLYTSKGEYRIATEYLNKAHIHLSGIQNQSYDNLIALYHAQAHLYNRTGDNSSYLIAVRNIVKLKNQYQKSEDATTAAAYENLGLAFEKLDQLDSAVIYYQKGLEIRRKTSSINALVQAKNHNNLALLMVKMNQFESACKNIDSAILMLHTEFSETKEIVQVYVNAAQIYSQSGNNNSAIHYSRAAIRIGGKIWAEDHPLVAQAYNNLGTYFGKSNSLDSAIYYVNKSFNIQINNLPYTKLQVEQIRRNLTFLYSQRAEQMVESKKLQLAIVDYLKALEFTENKGKLFNSLGLTYYDTQDYALAIENYEKSYELQTISEITYLNNIGLAYAKWGKMAEAKRRFSRLESISPESGLTFRDWGLYYLLKGRSIKALENLEKAIQLGYDNWEWLRTETALDPLRDHPRFQALFQQAPTRND